MKKEGITKGFRCVFSTEIQKEESLKLTDGSNFKKSFYGTISFMPALFGLNAAAEVINFLLKSEKWIFPSESEWWIIKIDCKRNSLAKQNSLIN